MNHGKTFAQGEKNDIPVICRQSPNLSGQCPKNLKKRAHPNEHSIIKFPQYLTPITNDDRSRLRSNTRPPERFNQVTPTDRSHFASARSRQLDSTSLKCVIEGKASAFKNGFFFRTHTIWNDLTVPLREMEDSNAFKVKLKEHMWDKMIDPH